MIGKKFNEISLPEKEDFYNHLNMEDISDADYTHEKGVCKDFAITNIVEYLDLCVHSDSFLLVNVSENFWNVCLEMCELEPACLLDAPGLAWQAALKRPK